jgi:putative alpha-1,2-mannosidase
MIGHHAVSVIADAYMKGLRNFDVDKTYTASRKSADTSLFGLPFFIEKGYIPLIEESESVSKTLEYAYNAWCIAQMAQAMGKETDYVKYIQRAQWRLLIKCMASASLAHEPGRVFMELM